MVRRFALPLLLAAALAVPGVPVQAEPTVAPTVARQAQLARWLRDDCGACHGMTLQGGLGSPLTAQALAGKPRDGLVATVLQGRPGTAMPPWQPFMTQEEAQWLIDRLLAGKPPPVVSAPPVMSDPSAR